MIDHRREVERFESAVDDPIVRFRSLSYPALWETWDARAAPEWLGRHVAELRGRYAVAVPAA
jgi:hypothetical protein